MKLLSSFIILASCIVFLSSQVYAQKRSNRKLKKRLYTFTAKKKYLSIGGSINAMNYFGDIVPKTSAGSTDIQFTRPQFTVYGQKRLHPNITARVGLSWGRLIAEDFGTADPSDTENGIFRYQRNLSFRNDIVELSAIAMWDLFGNYGVFYRRPKKPIPYVFAGVAGFYHNPKGKAPETTIDGEPLEEAGKWVALQPLKTNGEKYSRFAFAIPAGVGVRVRVSPYIDIAAEIGYRFTFTDYLDDVSGVYLDKQVFGDDNLAKAMHDRSWEPTSGLKGETRPAEYVPGLISLNDGTDNMYTRNSVPGAVRGKPDNDAYLITGFHFIYLFQGALKTPKTGFR
ncbi:DUF6089 family protein [Rapidithrix thailandica]|uniref:DUF6089 family protein n=1 Tax=Rapidithrix thailandica TaxID=413964 RepID=A0AAW9S5R9_9BACT